MEYNDDEINDLPYDEALQNDRRTYCIYYLSLMRSKHSFIFTFIYKKDYNSRIIKIDLFLVVFSANYAVNTLFYNDETMQNRAESKGLNLENQIPKIVYSTLISFFIQYLLKFLALSNNAIIDFKRNKNDKDIKEREEKLINKLTFKFVLILY